MRRFVDICVDAGVNVFDTADIYSDGKSEEVLGKALKGKRSFEQGKRLFTELSCTVCHHFGREGGGVGPDLTAASGTFSVHDLLGVRWLQRRHRGRSETKEL